MLLLTFLVSRSFDLLFLQIGFQAIGHFPNSWFTIPNLVPARGHQSNVLYPSVCVCVLEGNNNEDDNQICTGWWYGTHGWSETSSRRA